MDKKILIALSLISAFSIGNASGVNGAIENPSVNESQSMKTINDFSYDLRSLGPVNRLFNLTYWSPQKWQEALHEVSEMVDFYCTHPDADMTSTAYTYYRLFVYHKEVDMFFNSGIYDQISLHTLTLIYYMAMRTVNKESITSSIMNDYSTFLDSISSRGLIAAKLDKNYNDYVRSIGNMLRVNIYGED